MKKLSLFAILFFAYFCCVVNVFADGEFTTYKREFKGRVVSHYRSIASVNQPYEKSDSGFVTSMYNDDNLFHRVCNYDLFGTYSSGPFKDELICYRGPISNIGGSDKMAFHFLKRNWTTTDENGNVFFNYQYITSDYVEVVFPPPYPNETNLTGYRLDFSLHLNMNIIPQEARHQIFGSLYVQPNTNNGVTYCNSIYVESQERINITCSTSAWRTGLNVRISSNIPVVNSISDGNYNYYSFFDVSDYTTTATRAQTFDDLDMDGSPSGDSFKDDYNIIKGESLDYFDDGLSYSNFNSISRLLLKPLELLNIQPNKPKTLHLEVFGEDISFKNGFSLFWGKCSPTNTSCPNSRRWHDFYIGDRYFRGSDTADLVNDFKIFWNFLFGGFAIYILLKKAINVTMQVFDPNIMKVGDL